MRPRGTRERNEIMLLPYEGGPILTISPTPTHPALVRESMVYRRDCIRELPQNSPADERAPLTLQKSE
jgi:hypothetical protein